MDAEARSDPVVSWELFAHDADIGVRGRGTTLAQAFANAARAMTAAIADPARIELRQSVSIICDAPDFETRFLDWLNTLVFEMATRGMVFGAFDVTIDGHRLRATVKGETVDPDRRAPAVEAQGATYTELFAGERNGLRVA